jgi:small subunit ribosomal protein S20
MNLLQAASTVSLLTLASRITGLVREQLIAATFGASAATDAFNVAFRIPNLLRRLFAEGGGDELLAHQAGDAGGQRQQGNSGGGLEEVHGTRGLSMYNPGLRFQPPACSMATATKAKKKTVRIASGRKRARQDVKLNAANTALRSKFRSAVKGVQKAVASGDKGKAAELFKAAQSVIDSVADKGVFHKNKAARHKSRLAAKVKALATA